VQIVSGLLLLPALWLSLSFFIRAVINLWHNVLLLEIWKGQLQPQFDRGCFTNFAEVCGPKYCCCCWPCPMVPLTPAESGLYTHIPMSEVYGYTVTTSG
jgi:hypothetical protein